jgi:membrane dipeptidase
MSAPAELVRPRIDDLMALSIVWDNHGCMPLRWHDQDFLPQLKRYRDAGVDAATINIGFGDNSIEEHVRVIASMRHWLAAHADNYLIAGSVADIRRAKAEGKLAVLFDIEGMKAVDDQPSLVKLYYDLGVRWMLVAYNRNNKAGGGCQDEDCGLTALGEAILDEMAACGMLACCSHTGYRTVRQVIDRSPNPVIFSHSNPRALWDHYRNVPDELFKACAERGGVIGLNGIGHFLGDVSTETFVRNVDHVVQLVGPEHVALGLDYVFDSSEFDELIAKHPEIFPAELGYRVGMPMPMVEPERIPEIGQALLDRGYGEAAVAGILGGNLIRLAGQVWK